jgi:nucleoside-diphosphate-sugar epimerase
MTVVLVTGAGGFLGRAVVRELLGAGHHVRALVKSAPFELFTGPVDVIRGDVRDPQCAVKVTDGCDSVVHLAGKVHVLDDDGAGEGEYQSINVDGTRHLLEASAASGVRRFVFASSVKVFGETTSGCSDESAPPAPQTPYARSKWTAEQLVTSHAKNGRLETVSFRLPLVYGPTQKGNLYRMIAAIDRGWFPPLPHIAAVRSMLHVGNFVAAVQACLKAATIPKPMYIVADARPYSTTDLYELLRKGLGRPAPRWRVPLWVLSTAAACGDLLQALVGKPVSLSTSILNKLADEAWYSPNAMMRDLTYQPLMTFETAVPELIRHYRESLSRCGA